MSPSFPQLAVLCFRISRSTEGAGLRRLPGAKKRSEMWKSPKSCPTPPGLLVSPAPTFQLSPNPVRSAPSAGVRPRLKSSSTAFSSSYFFPLKWG